MVYAENIDAYVMYGGENEKRKKDSTTWLLKNGNWTEMQIPGPGSRVHFGMCYDPFRKKVVLYGGHGTEGLRQDTWEFDGKEWNEITSGDPLQVDYEDAWEFENNEWVTVTDNGAWKWNGKEYEKVK